MMTEIGIGLTTFGVAFLLLGVLLLFDKGLLAIGNVSVSGRSAEQKQLNDTTTPVHQILFLSGLGFIIGYERTFWFFFQKHKWKGSGFFFLGIFVVFIGWPVVGMCLEIYGFIQLFGSVQTLLLTDSVTHSLCSYTKQGIHSSCCLLPPSCPVHWHDFKPSRHLHCHGQDRR